MFWIVCLFSFARRWEGWLVGGSGYMKILNSCFLQEKLSHLTWNNGPASDSDHQAEELFSTIFISKWTDLFLEIGRTRSRVHWTTEQLLPPLWSYTLTTDHLRTVFAWRVKTLQNRFSLESTIFFHFFMHTGLHLGSLFGSMRNDLKFSFSWVPYAGWAPSA